MKKILIRSLVFCGILISLQSCFVAQEYERDQEPIDALKYRTDNIPTDTTDFAQVSWRQVFTDTILQSHINDALKNNQDIRIALQQIKAAQCFF